MRLAHAALPLLLAAVPDLAGPAPRYSQSHDLTVEAVARGLDHPVCVAAPPGDSRLFVVEQRGRIRIVAGGRVLDPPFLDLSDRVSYGGERGLLSVAFHPRFARNPYCYVNYTDRHGDTRIERFTVSPDSNRADPSSARLILTIAQPYANHNGGLVLFAPDGMLWIGMGDGGSAGDPHGNGQNPEALLGKMLRIDVDHGDPYAIPPDNPFARGHGGRPEIWALGLRNPWRFCFDRESGEVYIADVGQDLWEEVDVEPITAAGLNYGWNRKEGLHDFKSASGATATLTDPVLEYGHNDGCSVTGGLVYRGSRIPELRGAYLFSDYCRGWIKSFRFENGQARELREWKVGDLGPVVSFGTDAAGEVLVVGYQGRIDRIVPRTDRR
jgi:hypothetical protein